MVLTRVEKKIFLIFQEMELSSPKNKKFLILYNPNLKNFLWKKFLTFFPEKFPLWKNYLYFRKWNCLTTKKKVLIFSQKKVFLIFWVTELFSPKIKKFQEGTFRAWKIKKSTLKRFLTFQEIGLSSPKKS